MTRWKRITARIWKALAAFFEPRYEAWRAQHSEMIELAARQQERREAAAEQRRVDREREDALIRVSDLEHRLKNSVERAGELAQEVKMRDAQIEVLKFQLGGMTFAAVNLESRLEAYIRINSGKGQPPNVADTLSALGVPESR